MPRPKLLRVAIANPCAWPTAWRRLPRTSLDIHRYRSAIRSTEPLKSPLAPSSSSDTALRPVEHFRFVLFDLATCKVYAEPLKTYPNNQLATSAIFEICSLMTRKKLIAANWKMYKTPDQARDFFRDFLPLVAGHDRDEIVVCPNYLAIDVAVHAAKGTNVAIGAQDLHWEKEGAFTGEICTSMLTAVGVTHVIIGHSERRQYFGETDDTVNLKLKSAIEAGLIPIVCVGEVLEEREAGLTDDVLRRQCLRAFNKVSAKKAAQPGSRLRTGLGHRHRKNCHAGDGRRCPRHHSWRSRRFFRPGIRRQASHPLWRFGKT